MRRGGGREERGGRKVRRGKKLSTFNGRINTRDKELKKGKIEYTYGKSYCIILPTLKKTLRYICVYINGEEARTCPAVEDQRVGF